jgi:hypothetical protein
MATPFFRPNHPEEGATYWNLHCGPVLDEAGQVARLVVAFEDVTGHKHAETRLKAMNALLGLFASKTTRKSYLDGGIELLSLASPRRPRRPPPWPAPWPTASARSRSHPAA